MLTLVTPPQPLVTLQEAKIHMRVSHGRENDHLDALIKAATEYLDGPTGIMGRCLGIQTWDMTIPAFSDPIKLEIGPAVSVESIKYFDVNGAEQTLPDSEYYLMRDGLAPYVRLKVGKSWPSVEDRDDAITIRFVAGVETVPRPIWAAILMIASHLEVNREIQVTERTFSTGFSVDDLIAPYRRINI